MTTVEDKIRNTHNGRLTGRSLYQGVVTLLVGCLLFGAGEARSGISKLPHCSVPENQSQKQNDAAADPVAPVWMAKGTLFEACSCHVPCPCNFGQSPSNGSCNTIYAYRLKTARYGGVTLDGLIFGGGEAASGAMGFVDGRATAAQRPLLEKLALAVFGKGGASGGPRKFVSATLVATDTPTQFQLSFGDSGGFAANVLIGADGKNPIIVENNTTWPVHRFIKGKTSSFDYHDTLGNRLKYDGVNANLGEFDLHN